MSLTNRGSPNFISILLSLGFLNLRQALAFFFFFNTGVLCSEYLERSLQRSELTCKFQSFIELSVVVLGSWKTIVNILLIYLSEIFRAQLLLAGLWQNYILHQLGLNQSDLSYSWLSF